MLPALLPQRCSKASPMTTYLGGPFCCALHQQLCSIPCWSTANCFNSPRSFPPLRDFFPVSRGKCCALSFCVCFFCDLFCSSVPRHHAGQRATLFPHILPPHCLSLGSIRRFDLGAIGCGLFGRRCNTTFKIGNNPTASQCTLKSP